MTIETILSPTLEWVPTIPTDSRTGRHRTSPDRVGFIASTDARIDGHVRDAQARRGLYAHQARHNAGYVR